MADEDPLDDVPIEFRERLIDIIAIIDKFCADYLNDEYRDVCHQIALDFCQEDSPVRSGKASSWAAGIIWAAGRVNFLSDRSTQLNMTQEEFASKIKVSTATISAKVRIIWDGLDIVQLDPDYTIASRLERNPLVWLVEVNGIPVDLRMAPREVQVVCFENGLIPYIPADREDE